MQAGAHFAWGPAETRWPQALAGQQHQQWQRHQQQSSRPQRGVQYALNAQGEEESAGCVLMRARRDSEAAGGEVVEALIIQRGGSRGYELPKGHLEQDETAEQAAVRELREETGLVTEVELGDFVGESRYKIRSGNAKWVRFFAASCPSSAGPLEFGLGKEKATTELRWVTLQELPQVQLKAEATRRIIRMALDKQQQRWSQQPRCSMEGRPGVTQAGADLHPLPAAEAPADPAEVAATRAGAKPTGRWTRRLRKAGQ